MIEPKIVKGFRDFLPKDEEIRQELMDILKQVFLKYQYRAIDTPILEYAETLLGKSGGETEKQIFRFTDNGGRDVAMRFDLTVPFARYLAMHKEELTMPFRRYHMAKVWRGEKPQKGRYREFIQCDFDIVGDDSLQSDLDILLTVYDSFKALRIDDFVVYINHRVVLNQFFSENNLQEHSEKIMHEMDKILKTGEEATRKELASFLTLPQIDLVMGFMKKEATFKATLAKIENNLKPSEAVDRLKNIEKILTDLNIVNYFDLNPVITRGLDYYTGLVFETFLTKLPTIGSVCSGGRYDGLVGLYSKDNVSGIGGSIGLDRLIAALEELDSFKILDNNKSILVLYSDAMITENNLLAQKLRDLSFKVQVYSLAKKFDAQLKYALRNDMAYMLFFEDEKIKLKLLKENKTEVFDSEELCLQYMQKLLKDN